MVCQIEKAKRKFGLSLLLAHRILREWLVTLQIILSRQVSLICLALFFVQLLQINCKMPCEFLQSLLYLNFLLSHDLGVLPVTAPHFGNLLEHFNVSAQLQAHQKAKREQRFLQQCGSSHLWIWISIALFLFGSFSLTRSLFRTSLFHLTYSVANKWILMRQGRVFPSWSSLRSFLGILSLFAASETIILVLYLDATFRRRRIAVAEEVERLNCTNCLSIRLFL